MQNFSLGNYSSAFCKIANSAQRTGTKQKQKEHHTQVQKMVRFGIKNSKSDIKIQMREQYQQEKRSKHATDVFNKFIITSTDMREETRGGERMKYEFFEP